MWNFIIKSLVIAFSGIGAKSVLDIFAPKTIPEYYPQPVKEETTTKLLRIGWLVFAFVIGALVVRFVGRKLNVKLLK